MVAIRKDLNHFLNVQVSTYHVLTVKALVCCFFVLWSPLSSHVKGTRITFAAKAESKY